MGFSVEGDYFETCTCDVSCPCINMQPATNDTCDVMLAWHIANGSKDDVDLSGLNAVMAVHSPKQMTDGNWRIALYLDDKATPEQAAALGAVFSGAAGGHLANLGPLIGEVTGVSSASISIERTNGSRSADVAGVLHMEAEDGTEVIENAPFGAVTQPLTQARAGNVSYHGAWDVEFSGTNSFSTTFAYSG